MGALWNLLKGKKTYMAAIGGILIAIGSGLTGQMEWAEAAKVAFTALIGMTIRHGIK